MQALRDALQTPGIYQLRGAAGSGKTTLVRALLRRLAPRCWTVALLAPTWAAANRLTVVIGPAVLSRVNVARATSLHRYIYGRPVEQRLCSACNKWSASLFKPTVQECIEAVDDSGAGADGTAAPHAGGQTIAVKRAVYVCDECKHVFKNVSDLPERLTFSVTTTSTGLPRLVVIDEASMLSKGTLADIEAAVLDGCTRVLLVGDPNQIPPVSTPDNPQEPIDFETPTAALDRVHRQAEGNPVLALAHANKSYPVATAPEWPFPRAWHGDPRVSLPFGGVAEIARWHATRRSRGDLVVTVALSNAMRARVNCTARGIMGLADAARALRQPFVPGDRILLRSNCLPSNVYNGEMHVIAGIWPLSPGTALLDAALRCSVRTRGSATDARRVERDDFLSSVEIGVWQIQTWPLFAPPEERRNGYVVAPIVNGQPMLESDFIANDTDPSARSRARTFTRAWVEEYRDALNSLEPEHAKLRNRMETVSRWLARLRTRPAPGVVVHAFRELAAVFPSTQQESVRQAAMTAYEEHRYDDIEAVFWSQKMTDCALAETTEDYAVLRYGALRPGRVWNVDYGECVTGHAMQGSQADHVAVVCDRSFWGLWLKDRVAGMKWMYTAMTRTTDQLALFRVPKGAE
jgi:hypothetical protein